VFLQSVETTYQTNGITDLKAQEVRGLVVDRQIVSFGGKLLDFFIDHSTKPNFSIVTKPVDFF
jgi:hypothetical protein